MGRPDRRLVGRSLRGAADAADRRITRWRGRLDGNNLGIDEPAADPRSEGQPLQPLDGAFGYRRQEIARNVSRPLPSYRGGARRADKARGARREVGAIEPQAADDE